MKQTERYTEIKQQKKKIQRKESKDNERDSGNERKRTETEKES